MLVLTKAKSDKDVGSALEALIDGINEELEKVEGIISRMDCDIAVGPLDATVSVSVFLEGDEPRRKFLVGVNEKGFNRDNSMKRAAKRVNAYLDTFSGTIAGSFVKVISHLPGRVYTTMIIAANANSLNKKKTYDTATRRKRIKKGLELLGEDPGVLNVARLANLFGVSRTMIYKDLEVLGYKRS